MVLPFKALAVSVGLAAFFLTTGQARAICEFENVSKHVWVIHGAIPQSCPIAEHHPLTNPIAVLTGEGVVLVDPGSTASVTGLVLNRLKDITAAPVVAVFNSHIHGLYWLGNATVAKEFPGIEIYAHERMIERLSQGEDVFWAETILGDRSEPTVTPTIGLTGGESIEIGGLTFRIHFTGHAHTDHDLMIELVEDSVLFLGGQVVEPEIPSQGVPSDADFRGQIEAIEYAQSLPVEVFVPGRGQTGGEELPRRALAFLNALYTGVEAYYDEGLVDYEIAERLRQDLKEFQEYYDFAALGRVVSHVFHQVEFEKF